MTALAADPCNGWRRDGDGNVLQCQWPVNQMHSGCAYDRRSARQADSGWPDRAGIDHAEGVIKCGSGPIAELQGFIR